jgi:hypothetical protein
MVKEDNVHSERETEEYLKDWRSPQEIAQAKREEAVIGLLAKKAPLNNSQICRELVPRYGSEFTMFYAVGQMERKGLITPRQVQERARGGRPSKFYDLTLLGLTDVLDGLMIGGTKRDWKSFDMLVKKYEHLLPSFSALWPFLVEIGVRDETNMFVTTKDKDGTLMPTFSGVLSLIARGAAIQLGSEDPERKDDHWRLPSTERSLVKFLLISLCDEDPKWLTRIRGNTSLREETVRMLREQIKEDQGLLEHFSNRLRKSQHALAVLEQTEH